MIPICAIVYLVLLVNKLVLKRVFISIEYVFVLYT
jgi:hypothetical protein